MKNLFLTTALITLAIAAQPAAAEGFLDTINKVTNTVNNTLATGERAQRTTERVMNKLPEKKEEPQQEEQPQAEQPAPKEEIIISDTPLYEKEPLEPTTTEEEEEILS